MDSRGTARFTVQPLWLDRNSEVYVGIPVRETALTHKADGSPIWAKTSGIVGRRTSSSPSINGRRARSSPFESMMLPTNPAEAYSSIKLERYRGDRPILSA